MALSELREATNTFKAETGLIARHQSLSAMGWQTISDKMVLSFPPKSNKASLVVCTCTTGNTRGHRGHSTSQLYPRLTHQLLWKYKNCIVLWLHD
jgi:hypothetical protein